MSATRNGAPPALARPRRRARELRARDLRRRVAPQSLPFRTTAEVEPLARTIGQPRAVAAIEFALAIGNHGFNIFVAGAPGYGRTSAVREALQRAAAARPAPPDIVYVHNFVSPERPNAIRLATGGAAEFARSMDELVAGAKREISRAFESDEFERRRRRLLEEVAAARDELNARLQQFAREHGWVIESTPVGFGLAPVRDGRPLRPSDFEQLPDAERQEIEAGGRLVQVQVAEHMRNLRALEKRANERVRELEREVALFAVGPLLHELRERYAAEPAVLEHLEQVEADMLDHLDDFRAAEEQAPILPFLAAPAAELGRYRVNVFVDNGGLEGAPVVFERNPTYYNLVGRVDYRPAFGTMVTDFRQVRAGALHRANGGFLVVDALDLLRQPFAWDALKRTLQSHEIRIENLGEQLSAFPTVTLRPEPIPLDVRVVLIGPPLLYRLLLELEQDFRSLFKVKADFAPDMPSDADADAAYAAFVSRRVREEGLRHFRRDAVARVIEHGSRLAEHQRKLSTRLSEIADLVAEASFWAGERGGELVAAADVDRAVAAREYRSNLVEERVRELVADGTLRIETRGERVGQVNGISVADLGDYAFGTPTRVSARVALGHGTLESIEREIELSGPIHSKGFLIVAGYLAAKYAQELPLALAATLTFEQSYDEVEGDSASCAELCALLSALAGLPVRQGIAVTGSVDQHGDVQAVGGVTAKIEGFFAACRAHGLTGDQGVIVPAANVPHLCVRDEVADAVAAGRFHVWAVTSVDEAVELLTGRPAGRPLARGGYRPDTVHALVHARLKDFAERLREFDIDGARAARGRREKRR